MRLPQHGDRSRWVRFLVRSLVALVVVIVLAVALAAWMLLFRSEVRVASGEEVRVEILEGSTTAAIGSQLAGAGVIRNQYMFRLQARLRGADGSLAPGVYDLTTRMKYSEVFKLLKSGPSAATVSVTIPEGFVLEQIAARLEDEAGIPAKETLALAKGGAAEFAGEHPYLSDAHDGSLEGYLFPKTYSFIRRGSARDAIEIMLDQFDREIEQVDLSKARSRGLSLNEVVVLASIIEREAQLDAERALVSSVVYNRLERGMLLEIDATVEYVLPGNRFRLRYSDLKVDSPYNTYRVKGLPPGPIASPGLASLEAAVEPADTDFVYYVLTGLDGSHTFATNQRDFLRAKEKSKEVFGR